ncbi:SHOCT domain-containing protein [Kitasatospora sp. GAS204B]|uniref:SHOCT domain-containing protein n=1 Tax=unclassified Kitasatospora TaxID=2633591 RepID=UPI002473FED9|nr:SHOCT domain-containing protein [Kitasatospora sp. GAS204B]MDH6121900.1 hypothetical protein [Kitasatospora sp. GAS204B]
MPGLLRGVARTAVIAGTATTVSNRVSRRQAGRWAEQDATAQPAAAPPAATAPLADTMDDKIAQIKQLGDLKAQGLLTDAEFEAQKSQILNS